MRRRFRMNWQYLFLLFVSICGSLGCLVLSVRELSLVNGANFSNINNLIYDNHLPYALLGIVGFFICLRIGIVQFRQLFPRPSKALLPYYDKKKPNRLK